MISAGMLKQTALVERGTDADDATGFIDVWASPTTVASDVKGSLQPRSQKSKVYAEGRVVNGNWVFYCNFGPDILESDRLTISGKQYDVMKVDDAAGRGHHLEIGLDPFQPQRAP